MATDDFLDRDFIYVRRTEGFDVVYLGGGPQQDHFPAHVAHAEDERWAQRIVAALDASPAASPAPRAVSPVTGDEK